MLRARAILTMIALTIGLGLTTAAPLARHAVAAEPVTDANVVQAIASAKTPDHHKAIAAYFREQAKREGDKATLHENMIKSWDASVSGKALDRMREHCHGLIAEARKMQTQYEALAAEYDALAKAATH